MWTRRGKRRPQQWSSSQGAPNSGLEEYTAAGDDGTLKIASSPYRVAETIKRGGPFRTRTANVSRMTATGANLRHCATTFLQGTCCDDQLRSPARSDIRAHRLDRPILTLTEF